MVDPEAGIREAIRAIRKAAQSDLEGSRSALLEIQRQTELIERLTRRIEVRREAEQLMSSALDRFAAPGNSSDLMQALRLHGAVTRFQYALQQLGVLKIPAEPFAPPRRPGQRPH